MSESSCSSSSDISESPEWIQNGGFLALVGGVMAMFWGLSFVCEEYCVPAITIFCKKHKVSDDIAGAIFIGAGLSLPVLFASFIGLFVYNTAIGVGTVVGGNIFNNLINVALSIYVAPEQELKLNPIVFTREFLFYGLSCLITIWAAKGSFQGAFQHAFQHNEWTSCLSINWYESTLLIVGYIIYCIVEAYSESIQNYFSSLFFKSKEYSLTERDSISLDINEQQNILDIENNPDNMLIDFTQTEQTSLPSISSTTLPVPELLTPTTVSDLLPESLQNLDILDNFSMYIRSSFYSTHNFGCFPSSRKWKLRFFHLSHKGLFYRLYQDAPMRGSDVRFVNIFDLEHIKISNLENHEFSIQLRSNQKTFYFRVPDREIFTAVILKLQQISEAIKFKSDSELLALAIKSMNELAAGVDQLADPDSETIGDTYFIPPVSIIPKFFYYFLLPLKILLYYTIPDVRQPGAENKDLLAIGVSFTWVGAMTYVLIALLTELGNLLKVSGTVMGLTIGAWAASFPAAWSSIVVARNGYGDIAMCNALGSNVFSFFIGLGLPWLSWIIVYNSSYNALEDDGVVLSILGLLCVLTGFYILIALSNFTLKFWMVPVFTLVYIGFITYFVYFTVVL